MRRLIFQNMMTLDGFFEGPKREIDWHVVDEEFNVYVDEFFKNIDTLIFGRITYELMAGYWPTENAKSDDPIIAGLMNNYSKIVFSTSLDSAAWNNTRVVKLNPVEEIIRLKSLPGKDMVIIGSANLASTFI